MRLRTIKSKNSIQYAIIKDYTTTSGKRTTSVYENLGNQDKVELRFGKENTIEEIKKYINSLNETLKQGKELPVNIIKNPNRKIEKNVICKFNIGYLFLKDIYYSLKLNEMCETITNKYQYKFNLNEIMECLIYSRILWPSSKLATYKQADKFIEKLAFSYNDIIRSLSYLANEFDYVQKYLFESSNKVMDRNYKVIYYDCTNFFFYTEENDFQKYGVSKEHQPLPLVQMGLFMDADGLPFALNINPGNTNETTTMIPSEEKFLKDYDMDGKNIVVCTDAAMCTDDIKKFNIKDGRGFVITQSLKKIKKELQEWALNPKEWRILGNLTETYNIKDVEKDANLKKYFYDKTFYKEIECETKSVKQTFIVTFSFRYQAWQRNIRKKQYERAKKLVDEVNKKNQCAKKKTDVEKIKITKNPNDPKRFIKEYRTTDTGEVAENITYTIDDTIFNEEEKFDGFYGITTNLINDTKTVIKVMNGRWEIEESFRIMKEEFDSDNAYLSREDRIKAHFLSCYLALFIYRVLEHKLQDKYTVYEIIDCLRDMEVLETKGDGYLPAYTRTDLTDDLHRIFGLDTDAEIISYKKFKKILNQVKAK